MRKLLLIITAGILLFSCGRYTTQVENKNSKQMISGGYSAPRALSADELTLFKELTDSLDGVKYTPQSVATQVVAGRNYRFVCKASTLTRKPQSYQAEIIVYQPLPGHGEARITKISRL